MVPPDKQKEQETTRNKQNNQNQPETANNNQKRNRKQPTPLYKAINSDYLDYSLVTVQLNLMEEVITWVIAYQKQDHPDSLMKK